MDLYIVQEEAGGWIVGAFTTIKKAMGAQAVRENDGFPCRDIQTVICNNIEEIEDDEPQD